MRSTQQLDPEDHLPEENRESNSRSICGRAIAAPPTITQLEDFEDQLDGPPTNGGADDCEIYPCPRRGRAKTASPHQVEPKNHLANYMHPCPRVMTPPKGDDSTPKGDDDSIPKGNYDRPHGHGLASGYTLLSENESDHSNPRNHTTTAASTREQNVYYQYSPWSIDQPTCTLPEL
jgi:hypothetical protein